MNRHVDELKSELEDELNVVDEALEDEDEGVTHYDITSYGIDFDVEGLVKRIKRKDVFIPPFQRNFVWKLPESSRLIESLLLGLPVPGIFLAQESDSGKMLVIDGQQRLLSLYYFFEGYFNYKENDDNRRVFKLSKVQAQFSGRTYESLESKDRINLENSVIHATVVKQDTPADDDTSIYQIFQRLNSGGKKLTPQEIRTAVYHGSFIEHIKLLNEFSHWRNIYGRLNERMKDQELIIRFFAMLEGYREYKQPMTEFISKFTKKHRKDSDEDFAKFSESFKICCKLFDSISGLKPFRLGKALNVAFFEAAMVGLANQVIANNVPDLIKVTKAYDELRSNEKFIEVISQSTGNPSSVKARIEIAIQTFSNT